MAHNHKSKALEALHEPIEGLHEIGLVGGEVMIKFDRSCLVPGNEGAVADYKYVLKAAHLTPRQKQVFTMLCLIPTSHPYSVEFKAKCWLTAGGIRSALQALQKHELIIKDPTGVWRLRDPGMQAWWYAIQTDRLADEIEDL